MAPAIDSISMLSRLDTAGKWGAMLSVRKIAKMTGIAEMRCGSAIKTHARRLRSVERIDR